MEVTEEFLDEGDDGVEGVEDGVDSGDGTGEGGDEVAVDDDDDLPVITSVFSYVEGDDDDLPVITSVYSCA